MGPEPNTPALLLLKKGKKQQDLEAPSEAATVPPQAPRCTASAKWDGQLLPESVLVGTLPFPKHVNTET